MSDPARKRRRSRNQWTLIAFAPGAVIAAACFVRAAWWAMVEKHPKWDDYFMVAVVWLMAALGSAILLRVTWAAISPERWLPRWLAIVVLAAAMSTALLALLFVWFASAWGP